MSRLECGCRWEMGDHWGIDRTWDGDGVRAVNLAHREYACDKHLARILLEWPGDDAIQMVSFLTRQMLTRFVCPQCERVIDRMDAKPHLMAEHGVVEREVRRLLGEPHPMFAGFWAAWDAVGDALELAMYETWNIKTRLFGKVRSVWA